jgi:hypothetical protein
MDTEEPKVTYKKRVCLYVCACVQICVRRERKGMTANMNRQIPETVDVLRTVQRHQCGSDEQPYARIRFQHASLKPLKRISTKRKLRRSPPILVVTVMVQGNARKGAKQIFARRRLQAIGRTWCLHSGLGCVLLPFEMERRRLLHSAKVYRVHSI